MLLALLLALLAAGCTNVQEPTGRGEALAGSRSGAETGAWCTGRDEPLTCIEDMQVLRAVVYRGNPASNTLTHWDPGGPGLGLPDADTPFREVLPRAIRDQNVMLVVEPWVRNPPSEGCLGASSAEDVARRCDVGAFVSKPGDLMAAAQLTEKTTGLKVTAAYLQSFGATRTLPALAAAQRRLAWVVLESPGPPPRSDAYELMELRKAATIRPLVERCQDRVCRRAVVAGTNALATEGVSGVVTGREFALGILGMATLPEQNATLIAQTAGALSKGISPKPGTLKQIKRVGRLYGGQRPGGGITASQIGFWADTCPRLSGWDRIAESKDPFLNAFAFVYRGCRDAKPLLHGAPNYRNLPPVMMLTGRDDPLVPGPMQDRWKQEGLTATTVVGHGHFWESDKTTRAVAQWIAQRQPELED